MDNYRILIVDDIADIHKDFRKILVPENQSSQNKNMQKMNDLLFGDKQSNDVKLPPFELDSAYQGFEAVKLVEEAKAQRRPYAVAFVDVQMPPGMDGVFTIKKLWEIDPNIQVVICTAYAQYSWQDLVKHLGESDHLFVLKKPFDQIEIVNLAISLTKRWNLNRTLSDSVVVTPAAPKSYERNPNTASAKEKFEQAIESLKKLNKGLDPHKLP